MSLIGFGCASGFGLRDGFDRARATGPRSTVVAMGEPWAAPNAGEPTYLAVADPLQLHVGDTVSIDDGVHQVPGIVEVIGLGEGFENWAQFGWLPGGPPGGTLMADGATVTVV